MKICFDYPFPEGNRVDTYADCNLVLVEYSKGYDYGMYVYDATTHALVGGMYGTDYDAYVCGTSGYLACRRVHFRRRAARFRKARSAASMAGDGREASGRVGQRAGPLLAPSPGVCLSSRRGPCSAAPLYRMFQR